MEVKNSSSSRKGNSHNYSTSCSWLKNSSSSPSYSMCWWQNLKGFAGPSGNRTSKIIEFINPKWADINHVVGWRELAEPAFKGRKLCTCAHLQTTCGDHSQQQSQVFLVFTYFKMVLGLWLYIIYNLLREGGGGRRLCKKSCTRFPTLFVHGHMYTILYS